MSSCVEIQWQVRQKTKAPKQVVVPQPHGAGILASQFDSLRHACSTGAAKKETGPCECHCANMNTPTMDHQQRMNFPKSSRVIEAQFVLRTSSTSARCISKCSTTSNRPKAPTPAARTSRMPQACQEPSEPERHVLKSHLEPIREKLERPVGLEATFCRIPNATGVLVCKAMHFPHVPARMNTFGSRQQLTSSQSITLLG